MKPFILLLFINISFLNNGLACSCGEFPDFFKNKNIRDYSQNCIAVLDSLSYAYEYMGLAGQTGHFTLVDTINSVKSTIGQPILVVGQDGLNCGALVHNLTVGDTFLLALSSHLYEPFEKDTFYLDGCGTFYVNLTDDQFEGWTTSSLKEQINLITTSNKNTFLQKSVLVFPNPVIQNLVIKSELVTMKSIKIYDGNGRLLLNLDGLESKMEEVIISEFAKGFHFLLITTAQGIVHKKFIKN